MPSFVYCIYFCIGKCILLCSLLFRAGKGEGRLGESNRHRNKKCKGAQDPNSYGIPTTSSSVGPIEPEGYLKRDLFFPVQSLRAGNVGRRRRRRRKTEEEHGRNVINWLHDKTVLVRHSLSFAGPLLSFLLRYGATRLPSRTCAQVHVSRQVGGPYENYEGKEKS